MRRARGNARRGTRPLFLAICAGAGRGGLLRVRRAGRARGADRNPRSSLVAALREFNPPRARTALRLLCRSTRTARGGGDRDIAARETITESGIGFQPMFLEISSAGCRCHD